MKGKLTGQTSSYVTKIVEIIPLKYLSNVWRTLEVPLINCVIVSIAVTNQGATFAITDLKLYILVVTLSTQDNTKLLQH